MVQTFSIPGSRRGGFFCLLFALIQGFVFFTGLVFVLVNLAVDLLYRAIDPGIRLTSHKLRRGNKAN